MMIPDPSSTFHSLESTILSGTSSPAPDVSRNAPLLPTQTLRYEPTEVSDMLDQIAGNDSPPGSLLQIDIADQSSERESDSDLVVLHEIGRGGVGVVSAAEQLSLGRAIAIKQLRDDRDSTSSRTQLILEAKIQARLNHPGIPPVHLIGVGKDGNPILVMQLIRGEVWSDVLHQDALQLHSGSEAKILDHLEILVRICETISYSHEQRVIHRDIKPGNVMVGRHGEVYVLDWGLAAELDGEGSFTPQGFTGTPAYAAPEMIQRGGVLDPRTDVYLLGSTLCELLTGEPPHRGDSINEVFLNISKNLPLNFPHWTPSDLANICRRALDPEPAMRFQTVDEFLNAIRTYMEHHQSIGMLDRVRDHIKRLDEMIATNAPAEGIDDLGQACRVMLEALRVQLPQEEEISRLHQRCSTILINRMIESNNPGAARIMLESIREETPEVEELRRKVEDLSSRLLARPTHVSTNVQLMLTEQLVAARQEIARLKAEQGGD